VLRHVSAAGGVPPPLRPCVEKPLLFEGSPFRPFPVLVRPGASVPPPFPSPPHTQKYLSVQGSLPPPFFFLLWVFRGREELSLLSILYRLHVAFLVLSSLSHGFRYSPLLGFFFPASVNRRPRTFAPSSFFFLPFFVFFLFFLIELMFVLPKKVSFVALRPGFPRLPTGVSTYCIPPFAHEGAFFYGGTCLLGLLFNSSNSCFARFLDV